MLCYGNTAMIETVITSRCYRVEIYTLLAYGKNLVPKILLWQKQIF